MSRVGRQVRRWSRLVAISTVGFSLLIAGLALSLPAVPGPGLLLIIAGLAVLSTEFRWAQRLATKLKRRIAGLRDRISGSTPHGEASAAPKDDSPDPSKV